jgi:hypothetical protein
MEEQHEPQAIGQIRVAGEIYSRIGHGTNPKRETAPDMIKSCNR